MPRTSNKVEKRTVEELNGRDKEVFKGMVSEMSTIMQKIKLFQGTLDDIRDRCVEELGVSKTDLNYVANAAADPDTTMKKYHEVDMRAKAAEDLGYISLQED